jgi:uncharacterized membrane protein
MLDFQRLLMDMFLEDRLCSFVKVFLLTILLIFIFFGRHVKKSVGYEVG